MYAYVLTLMSRFFDSGEHIYQIRKWLCFVSSNAELVCMANRFNIDGAECEKREFYLS